LAVVGRVEQVGRVELLLPQDLLEQQEEMVL
jgi:hypothetical protein